jgi:murein DD-endopeptidase MepM/ murein hydrolase activator NlpD
MSRVVLVLFFLILAISIGTLEVLSGHSTLVFDPAPKAIGESTAVRVRITNPHGTRRAAAFIEQNGSRSNIAEENKPTNRFMFWRTHAPSADFQFIAGRANAPSLKEGKARLIVEAQSNDLRGSTDSITTEVDVIFRPPSVTTDSFQHYINQGGSEMALITPSGFWSEAGVRVGDHVFRSFPLNGPLHGNERIALFAFPWDMPRDTAPVVFVRNTAGTEATARFWFKVFPKKFRARDLPIDDAFLEKVVNQVDPSGSGDLLTRFLKINGDMRRENNKTLADLRLKTEEKFLWTEPFLQLVNSKVESSFADVRSYIYKGKKVDQQTHLGFDLAVGQHTPVPAANDGKVVWAGPLGIYGNCIVVDHGFSLQSVYGHLSEIAVKEGQMVKRGETMGKSGSTGLAGGDHVHFSMQIDGVQVNPIEWWDQHWIHDHVLGRLQGSNE